MKYVISFAAFYLAANIFIGAISKNIPGFHILAAGVTCLGIACLFIKTKKT